MRAVPAAVVVICAAICSSVAVAQPADPYATPVHPGPQAAPPVHAGEPTLDQQTDGRRAIRGCNVDQVCGRAGGDRVGAELREFELERFPPPGQDPWLDERIISNPRSLEATPLRSVKKPSELRPDAPWLDTLELPDLPIRWSQKLVDYLVFYHDDPRGRSIMQSWLVKQGRYRDMILAYLRKAKLPQDLLYVAMIESGYDVSVNSSAGALGLWQFMPEGGRIYGLRGDRWVDERRDPYRSTIAQMDYFRDLYQRFADWPIALAAFNMGYGAMLRSVARYNTNDYYQLCEYENGIPWETCLYTPKILAAAIVGKNRAAFRYEHVTELPAERWDDVAVPVSVSLAIVARAAGSTEAEIKRLNPHLRHNRTPPGEPGYVVRVPAGAKPMFAQKLVELQSDWDGLDAYVVAHGERFEDVATTYGISLSALKRLNDVAHESEIAGGMVVVVPRISEAQRTRNRAKARSKLLGSGVDQKDGEALIVPVPDKDLAIAGKRRVFYRVVTGDRVKSIAGALGVTPRELAQWNALEADANLHPRMVLQAFVAADFDADTRHVALLDSSQLVLVTRGSPEHLDLAEARTGRVRTEYIAKAKEKLDDVAKKFGMGSHDLARINRISYNTVLAKGQAIIVYQVADRSRSKRANEQWRKTPQARRGKLAGARAPGSGSDANEDDADDDSRPVPKPSTTPEQPAAKPESTKSDAKPESKKPDSKQSDAKPDSKQSDAKPDSKRSDAKPASKQSDAKPDIKKSAKPASKQSDAKPAKAESRQAESKRTAKSEPTSESRDTDDKPTTRKSDAMPVEQPVRPEHDDDDDDDDDHLPAAAAIEDRAAGVEDGPVTRPSQVD